MRHGSRSKRADYDQVFKVFTFVQKAFEILFPVFPIRGSCSYCHLLSGVLQSLSQRHVSQEIKVGFRNPAGRLVQLQSFKTVQIPRLIRGKPGAWDPNLCLRWGTQFLTFLQFTIRNWDFPDQCPKERSNPPSEIRSTAEDFQENLPRSKEERVWRATFHPSKGVDVVLLDDLAVADVRNGEDRAGFLPRFYWDRVINKIV